MQYTAIVALALVGVSSAQSTVSLFIAGADSMPLIASAIASDSSATTFAVQCAPGTEGNDCGIPGGFVMTQGPDRARYTVSDNTEVNSTTVIAFTAEIDCSLAGTTSAVCVASYGGDEANFPGKETTTFNQDDMVFQTATLTAVTLRSTGSAAPASLTAAPTASNTSGSDTSIISGTRTTSSSVSGAQQTNASAATSSSTGGMAMITGNPWIVGGAALAAAVL
ncbi:hypothetical protein B0O99DRAFT_691242 [Bisporella sp. PMI_857]|nr:hypothetical protein B0O99DRAFT_691242 [Bisporella sp. PMI_857]